VYFVTVFTLSPLAYGKSYAIIEVMVLFLKAVKFSVFPKF